MGSIVSLSIGAAVNSPWIPAVRRSAHLKATGVALTGSYTTDVHAFSEPDEVYLQAVTYAEQVHPWTVEQVAALGPIEGPNARRWTMEGPTSLRPGEPSNCTLKVEVATSLGAAPGGDWRTFVPGMFKLRSYKFRATLTRPSADFDFRLYRLATRATRKAQPMRDWATERLFDNG